MYKREGTNTFLRVLKSNGRAVIWNRDNVSPLELGRRRFFFFVRVDFFETGVWQAGGWWHKKGGLPRNLRQTLHFPALSAYPIGIKLLDGGLRIGGWGWKSWKRDKFLVLGCPNRQIGGNNGVSQNRTRIAKSTHRQVFPFCLPFLKLKFPWHCPSVPTF